MFGSLTYSHCFLSSPQGVQSHWCYDSPNHTFMNIHDTSLKSLAEFAPRNTPNQTKNWSFVLAWSRQQRWQRKHLAAKGFHLAAEIRSRSKMIRRKNVCRNVCSDPISMFLKFFVSWDTCFVSWAFFSTFHPSPKLVRPEKIVKGPQQIRLQQGASHTRPRKLEHRIKKVTFSCVRSHTLNVLPPAIVVLGSPDSSRNQETLEIEHWMHWTSGDWRRKQNRRDKTPISQESFRSCFYLMSPPKCKRQLQEMVHASRVKTEICKDKNNVRTRRWQCVFIFSRALCVLCKFCFMQMCRYFLACVLLRM